MTATVEAAQGKDIRSQIAARIVEKGWALYELRGVSLSLEDIFLRVDHRRCGARAAVGSSGRRRECEACTPSIARRWAIISFRPSPTWWWACFLILSGFFFNYILSALMQNSLAADAALRFGVPPDIDVPGQVMRAFLRPAFVSGSVLHAHADDGSLCRRAQARHDGTADDLADHRDANRAREISCVALAVRHHAAAHGGLHHFHVRRTATRVRRGA